MSRRRTQRNTEEHRGTQKTLEEQMSPQETQPIRFQRLQQVCTKALEESQRVLTDANIASCYPSLTNSQEGQVVLQMVKSQILESWTNNSGKEFQAIFEERDIQQKLDDLDDLISKAQTRKQEQQTTEPQTLIDQLTPQTIVSSHLIPVKEANLKHLQTQLLEIKNSNEELQQLLHGMVAEAEELANEVTSSLQSVDKLVSIGESADLQEKLKQLAGILSTSETN